MGAITVSPDRLILTVGAPQSISLSSEAGRYSVVYPDGVEGPSEVVLLERGVVQLEVKASAPLLTPRSILIVREGAEVEVGVRIPVLALSPGARVSGDLEVLGLGRVAHSGETVVLRVKVGNEAPVYMTGSITVQGGARTFLRDALPGELLLPESEATYELVLKQDQGQFFPSRAMLEVVTPIGAIERPIWYLGSMSFWFSTAVAILVLVIFLRALTRSKRSVRRSPGYLRRLRWRQFR